MANFECQRCGRCCRERLINILYSDIMRWFKNGRSDILKEVSFVMNFPVLGDAGFYITETFLKPKKPCPFLTFNGKLATCTIHDTKPKVCVDAPIAYDKFPECPAWANAHFTDDEKTEVKIEQLRDLGLSYKNWKELLEILKKVKPECKSYVFVLHPLAEILAGRN